ncbi:MAG: tetratricopeptide repeat protein [Phycisphaerales bacterium]|nr:tetratricopeptide repeat protein [Phycisphaerales bacterium]
MATDDPIHPAEFVDAVRPFLARNDVDGMVGLVRSRWDDEQLAGLFAAADPDARKVAALAYGLTGGRCCLPQLAELLRDPDLVVAQMAEHALWSVWFRSGSPDANHQVCRGTRSLNRGDVEHAIEHFTRAIDLDPEFAEAYNQRAIAKFLLERFDDCVDDCRKAVKLMPCHFGALAGLGHCHAHEGRLVPALKCYERALAINPRLDDVRQTVRELRDQLCLGPTDPPPCPPREA